MLNMKSIEMIAVARVASFRRPASLAVLRLSMLSGAVLFASAPAFAQQKDVANQASSRQIEEVVVTANKRPQLANSVPMSITALTGEKLQELGITRPRDLVKVTPSLNYTDSYVGSPIYTLRGVGFNSIALGARPTVSIYTDQAPIPFSIESRGADLDLQRVEVLKGPQGTLFGQNATGGAINYIAAKPTDTFQTGFNVGYGNYNAIDASGFISGPLTDTLSGRLALETNQMDGWQKSYTTGKHNGTTNFTNGRLILAWKPSDRLAIQLNVNGFVDQSEVQAGQVIAITPELPAAAPLVPGLLDYPLAPQKATAADFNPDDNYHRQNHFFQANLRGDYSLGSSFTLTSLTSYSRFKEKQLQDIDGTTLSNLNQLTDGNIESASQELRISGSLDNRGHFVVGVNVAYDQIRENDLDHNPESTLAFLFTPFGLPLFTGFRDISNQIENTYAGFASGDYSLTQTFKIYGGIRYTRAIDRFNGCTADSGDGIAAADYGGLQNVLRAAAGLPPNPPIPPSGCVTADATLTPVLVRGKLNESNVSWRAGGSWTPSAGVMFYANVSKGYKAGSFPVLGATAASQLNPAVQEQLLAYEAGFKLTLFDRSLQLGGAGFHYDYTNKQILGKVLDPVLGPLLKLVNIPKSQINGAELELNWTPLAGLTLTAGGSYLATKILDHFTNYDPDGVVTDFNGEAFPNTPKWKFVSDARYEWALNRRWDMFAGANATYQTRTNSELGNLPLMYVRAHKLLDLRLGVETIDGVWSAMIWGHNVGNTYYWTSVNRNLDTTVRFAAMPATYGITVRYLPD